MFEFDESPKKSFAEVLKETADKINQKELRETIKNIRLSLMASAEKGNLSSKFEVSKKLVDDLGLIQELRTEFGEDLKMSKSDFTNKKYLISFNWANA